MYILDDSQSSKWHVNYDTMHNNKSLSYICRTP